MGRARESAAGAVRTPPGCRPARPACLRLRPRRRPRRAWPVLEGLRRASGTTPDRPFPPAGRYAAPALRASGRRAAVCCTRPTSGRADGRASGGHQAAATAARSAGVQKSVQPRGLAVAVELEDNARELPRVLSLSGRASELQRGDRRAPGELQTDGTWLVHEPDRRRTPVRSRRQKRGRNLRRTRRGGAISIPPALAEPDDQYQPWFPQSVARRLDAGWAERHQGLFGTVFRPGSQRGIRE